MSFLNDNFIADFFILAIEWIYQFLREYSLTMIVVALFVRLVLLPVDVKQRANSRKMASINPEVESLRKRYANNPEQCNLRINKLYKERGISPMAGCLPMLLQLVFLLAFYGALNCGEGDDVACAAGGGARRGRGAAYQMAVGA